MQVTAECRRTRTIGLAVIWAVVAGLLWQHSAAVRAYVQRLDALGLRGAATASTPLRRICPSTFADTQMWVRHALALADGAGPQLRHTDADNAPFGREVHWDSGLAWGLAAAGGLRHVVTGEPLATATEESLAWFNLPLLLGVVAFFSLWVSRRAGLGAGMLLAFMMIGSADFYVGFNPNYVDHHGLLSAAVLGLVLGVWFMGAGFWRGPESVASLLPESAGPARQAAVLSAVCGAIGMWISAATLVPAIALTGATAALSILCFGRSAALRRAEFDPSLWRQWGLVGALVSFGFYLLEYAPAHLGWRLEVNHPVYALAWWGGAEVIAQLGEWRAGSPHGRPGFRRLRLTSALAAMAVAPVLIALAGERVFVVFDPFVTQLSSYVEEGQSLLATIQLHGWSTLAPKVPWLVAVLGSCAILLWRGRAEERIVVGFGIVLVAGFMALGLAQNRWWPAASGPEFALILAAVAVAVRRLSPARRWVSLGFVVLLVCTPAIVGRVWEQLWINQRQLLQPGDAVQPLYRDLAARIRASRPAGDIVLLASPNASAAIAYYGRFKSIGTLYWENLDGTKAAADMFGAQSESEARRLLRRRGVTHLAMISDRNFLAEYFALRSARPGESLENSFGYQLLVQQQVPLWLVQVPYEPPPDAGLPGARVLLFQTRFTAPAAEAKFEAAIAAVEGNRLPAAERALDEALAIAPRSAEFWIIKSHLQLARTDVAGAVRSTGQALDVADPVQVYPICTGEASRFYQSGDHGTAATLYRRALAVQFDPTVACNLTWILASSHDARVRDGPAAVALIESLAHDEPNYLSLSGYAAALAECGRFREARAVADQLLADLRAGGDAALVRKAEAYRAAYAADRPWRE